MIEIGKKLQKRRVELNLSYQDISTITKLSIPHIKAIEEGNLDYFKNDLTYVRFYVRSYCKALNVPYENFKDDVVDSVDEYTNTITLKKQERIEQVEKAIAERHSKPVKANNIMRKEIETLVKENKGPKLAKKDFASIHQNANKNTRFKTKKVDIPMLSLLAVLVIIVGIVLYVGVGSLFDKEDPSTGKEDNPPVVDKVPTPEKDTDKDDPATVDKDTQDSSDKQDEKVVQITKENANSYIVSNVSLQSKVKVEVVFTNNICWFDGTFNNAPIVNTKTDKIYGPNETYTVENVAGANDVYVFNFGLFPGTKILVNGVEVALDPSLATAGNVQTIYVYVRGV